MMQLHVHVSSCPVRVSRTVRTPWSSLQPVRHAGRCRAVALPDQGATPPAPDVSQRNNLVIGCRGTKLALLQAQQVQEMLAHANAECLHTPSAVQEISTRGDESHAESLRAMGPGAFTEAIDEAVARGDIDIGVHSLKDSPLYLPRGVMLGACLPREDVRDALISKGGKRLDELPPGSRVGTSSTRRRAQVLAAHPHLTVVPLRGSVHSRMTALNEGKVDATILAAAGLKRLGLADKASQVFSLEEMLPAACQGAIGVTCRSSDTGMNWDLSLITHEPTLLEISCERAVLGVLLAPPPHPNDAGGDSSGSDHDHDKPSSSAAADAGSTDAPAAAAAPAPALHLPHFAIACNAHFEPSTGLLTCRGLVAAPDGSLLERVVRLSTAGRAADAEKLGRKVGRKLRRFALRHGWYNEPPAPAAA